MRFLHHTPNQEDLGLDQVGHKPKDFPKAVEDGGKSPHFINVRISKDVSIIHVEGVSTTRITGPDRLQHFDLGRRL